MAAEWWTKKLRVDARPVPYTVESRAAFFLENLWSVHRTRTVRAHTPITVTPCRGVQRACVGLETPMMVSSHEAYS